MTINDRHLQEQDPEIFATLTGEIERQRSGMELIASENYTSRAVLEALGSVFTNKYSEGYPGRRYYGGQQFTDAMETITINRAKSLFRADHANVQPMSGAAANVAAYFSWLEPGDCILGMDLSHGGHLTHGAPVTYISKLFRFVRYKMKDVETGEIDYDELRDVAKREKPKIVLAGFSAYPREYDYAKMKATADEVGAIAMADMAHIAGLIAGGVLKNPFDYGFNIMTTTTHKTLRGPRGGMILSRGVPGNPLKACEKTVANIPTLIDRSVFPGFQGGPHMHQVAAIGVALGEAATPQFNEYAQQVVRNAKAMADELMKLGCKLVTNGTDNHLMVVDCERSFGTHGGEIEKVLDAIHITTSKSTIPDDPRPPFSPSGLRLGTPAMTTRGVREEGMRQIARWIVNVANHRSDKSVIDRCAAEVSEYCRQFPIPGVQGRERGCY